MEFCPGCGKPSKEICKDCRPPRELKIKDITIKLCTCKKYYYKNKWTSFQNLKDAIIKIVKDKIKEKAFIKPEIKDFPFNPGVNVEIPVTIEIDEDNFTISVKLEITYCNICAKKQGDYFEGILQLRNINDTILDYVENFVTKNRVFISKSKNQPNGLDLTVSDQRKIQKLGKELKDNFGGTVKINARLHTKDKQTSKEVFRVNVFYEAPDFSVGDVIRVADKLVLISGIRKVITGVNLKSMKKVAIDIKNNEYKVLQHNETTISKLYPNLEVLDPETFQSVVLQNKRKVKIGEKVKVVNDNGLFYVL